jgi:hypothetical protein
MKILSQQRWIKGLFELTWLISQAERCTMQTAENQWQRTSSSSCTSPRKSGKVLIDSTGIVRKRKYLEREEVLDEQQIPPPVELAVRLDVLDHHELRRVVDENRQSYSEQHHLT